MHEHPGCIKAKEVYYSLGPRRTYRAVVKEMECYTHATISKWAKWFHWDDFVLSRDRGEYEGDLSVTAKLNQDAKELAASGNLETQIQQLIYKVDIALNGFFCEDEHGNIVPKFNVSSANDFKSIVTALKDLVVIKHEIARSGTRKGKEEKSQKTIENMNVFFGNLTEKQKMAFLRGGDIGDIKGRNPGTSGRVQEADCQEIPESEDKIENGRGCENLHCSSGESDTRDKGKL